MGDPIIMPWVIFGLEKLYEFTMIHQPEKFGYFGAVAPFWLSFQWCRSEVVIITQSDSKFVKWWRLPATFMLEITVQMDGGRQKDWGVASIRHVDRKRFFK